MNRLTVPALRRATLFARKFALFVLIVGTLTGSDLCPGYYGGLGDFYVPAGFSWKTPGRADPCGLRGTSSNSYFYPSDDWRNSGATLTMRVAGRDPRGLCGYVVRSAANAVAMSATVRVACSQVGNISNPPTGNCNNGDHSSANRMRYWDRILHPSATTPDSIITYIFHQDLQDASYWSANWDYSGHPSTPTSDGDMYAEVAVEFEHMALGQAEAHATSHGQIETQAKSILGPGVLDATQTGTWRGSSPNYDARLYSFVWYVDNTLQSGVTDSSLSRSLAGPGPHTFRVLMGLHDATVDTANFSVTPQAHAGVSGQGYITDLGNYTYYSAATGVTGATPAFAWSMIEDATGAVSSLGSGSSATVPIQYQSGSFTITVTVSATGYAAGASSMYVVVNTGNCGGFTCLLAPRKAPPTPISSGKVPKVH